MFSLPDLPIQGTTQNNLSEGSEHKFLKPREPITKTQNFEIDSNLSNAEVFIIPSAQSTPVVITLTEPLDNQNLAFSFKVINKSNQSVSFTDGTSVIVDIDGNGKVRQNGICEVQWDGSDFFLLGNLEF